MDYTTVAVVAIIALVIVVMVLKDKDRFRIGVRGRVVRGPMSRPETTHSHRARGSEPNTLPPVAVMSMPLTTVVTASMSNTWMREAAFT